MSKKTSGKPLREKLLAAALAQIKRVGAHELSLRLVAKAAGCTPMATYRHFASKEALIAEIAKEGFVHLESEMREAMALHPHNSLLQIEAAGERYIKMALNRPEHLLMMFGGFIKEPEDFCELKRAGDSAFFTLVEIMKRAQEQNLLPKTDPIKQAVSAWSTVHGFSMLIINGNLTFLGIDIKNHEEHSHFVAKSVLEGLKKFV